MSLKSEIEIIEKNAFNKAAKEYSKMLEDSVSNAIYDRPFTPYYDRTGDFLKSVSNPHVKWNNDSFSYDPYDEGKIHSRNGKGAISKRGNFYMLKFGHHKSFPWDDPYPDNEEVKENLFDWLNYGFTIFKKKEYPGFYFDIDEEVLWGLWSKYIIEGLKNRGII